MGQLTISRQQWEAAENYFAQNKEAKKFSKVSKAAGNFSFIKVEGIIYAMANTNVIAFLGKGGFAKVKLAQTKDGTNFAVKIEGKSIDRRSLKEIAAMKVLGKHVGAMERDLAEIKNFWRKDNDKPSLMTRTKSYKVVILEHGKELFDLLHHNTNPLTLIQRLQIAIKISQALRHIHDLGVIHADIKPENILVAINNDSIEVAILDFGFSIILPKGELSIKDEPKGTRGFIAPEIYNEQAPEQSQREFSFASDIYALGMMFKNHFGLAGSLFNHMTDPDPKKRPSLDVIESALVTALEFKQASLAKAESSTAPSIMPRPLPCPPKRTAPVKQSGTYFIAQLEAILSKPAPLRENLTSAIDHKSVPQTPLRIQRERQNRMAPMLQLNNELKERLLQKKIN